jgi:DNA polymerase III subunit delta'
MTLHPIRGHERVRATLANAHRRGVLPGALLLHGPRGIGKQHLALWLARLTVCESPGPEGPCDRCGPCRMALALEHPDIHWYFPLPRPKGVSGDRLADALEEARHEVLAEIRAESVRTSWVEDVVALHLGSVTNLRRTAAKRPSMAAGPVFIVGQAEMLVPQEASQEAANALLKLLEEPPGAARFVLTSSEPGLLLPTIRSRTVPLHVPPLSDEEVRAFLETHRDEDPETIARAVALAQGSPGRALGFLPIDEGRGPLEQLRRSAFEIVRAALEGRAARGFEIAIDYPPARARMLIDLFAFIEEWLRDLAAVAAGAPERVINHDALPALQKYVAGGAFEPSRIPDTFPAVERARELARGNVNPQLIVGGLVRDLRRTLRAGRALASAAR